MASGEASSDTQVVVGLFARHKKAFLTVAAAAILILAGLGYGGVPLAFARFTIDSLAVLPFTNGGGDANTDYLSDGITESLIDSLAHVPQDCRLVERARRGSASPYNGLRSRECSLGKQTPGCPHSEGPATQEIKLATLRCQGYGQSHGRRLEEVQGLLGSTTVYQKYAVSDKLRIADPAVRGPGMTMNSPSRDDAANPTKLNIEAIAKLEHEALHRRTIAERASDAIVKFIGSIAFLFLQVLLVLTWSVINLNLIPGVKAFDPFPFGILALVISSESVVLTIFVLISQNRMTRQAERRSHLDLQVGMLAEQELTTMLQMQHKICQRLDIDVESAKHELKGFSDATDVSKLASELEDKLPEQ
jgi:uncharacterized membrane protein